VRGSTIDAVPTTPKRGARRHSTILAAAADLFYERGFAAVGVDEIGARAGVTGPAIYRHFSGKDEILAALFEQALDSLVSATAGEFDDPRKQLVQLVRRHAEFVLRERKVAAVLIQEGRSLADPFRQRLERRERRYVEYFTACLRRCFPDRTEDELATATWVAIGALNSSSIWPREVPARDEVPDVLVELVLHGLDALDDQSRSDRRTRVRDGSRAA